MVHNVYCTYVACSVHMVHYLTSITTWVSSSRFFIAVVDRFRGGDLNTVCKLLHIFLRKNNSTAFNQNKPLTFFRSNHVPISFKYRKYSTV